MLLNKTQILGLHPFGFEDVPVDDADSIRIRTLSGKDRDTWDNAVTSARTDTGRIDSRGLRGLLCALSIVDENGKRIFKDEEADQLSEAWPDPLLDKVQKAAFMLSKLGGEAVEEEAKN